MSGTLNATVHLPLSGGGSVTLTVDVADLDALVQRDRDLLDALLGRVLNFAAVIYGQPFDTEQQGATLPPDPMPCATEAVRIEPKGHAEPPEPDVACPIYGCTFEGRGEQGIVLHLSRKHGLAGAGVNVKAKRQRLVDRAMGRRPKTEPDGEHVPPEPDGDPEPRPLPASVIMARARLSEYQRMENPICTPMVGEDVLDHAQHGHIEGPHAPPPAVDWPKDPIRPGAFDPDEARRRAAAAL